MHHFRPADFDIVSVTLLFYSLEHELCISVKVGRLGAETVGVNGNLIKSDTMFVALVKQSRGFGDSAFRTHVAGVILENLGFRIAASDTFDKRFEIESVAA